MQHTLKGRTTGLATALAATAILAGCSKEKAIQVDPNGTKPIEVTLYTSDGNTALAVSSSLSYILNYPEGADAPTGSTPMFDIDVCLRPLTAVSQSVKSTYGDTKIITKSFDAKNITAIDVIAGSDYDATHLKGSSLNDLMELHFIGNDGKYYSKMDLTEYFRTNTALGWNKRNDLSGWVFRLYAKTPPLKENEIPFRPDYFTDKEEFSLSSFGVTLKLTLADGTVLSIDPIPGQKE